MQSPNSAEASKAFTQGISDALSIALRNASSGSWQATAVEGSSTGPAEMAEAVVFRCGFEGALHGAAFLVAAGTEISKLELREAANASDEVASLLAALRECAPAFAECLKTYGELEIAFGAGEVSALPKEPSAELRLEREAAEEPDAASFYLYLSPELSTALQTASAKPFVFPDAGAASRNLDLVMDVELNVTLRFGQRKLPLREVLDLTSGSVVELDRQVDEPVELILDGRVVARGEAVIIDGNYGMRVTEIVQSVVA